MTTPKRKLCDQCGKNRALKFFTGTKGTVCSTCKKKRRRAWSHQHRIKETYGLEAGEYGILFDAQGGVCAICKGKRNYRLDVDHDHKTGFVRGLLCKACNRKILPHARDSPDVLRSAADYLENPPALIHIGERKVD